MVKVKKDSGDVIMGIDFGKSEFTSIAVFENKELVYCGQFNRNKLKKRCLN